MTICWRDLTGGLEVLSKSETRADSELLLAVSDNSALVDQCAKHISSAG